MSQTTPDTNAASSKPKAAAEQRMLAYVDKWLAVIREISSERK